MIIDDICLGGWLAIAVVCGAVILAAVYGVTQ